MTKSRCINGTLDVSQYSSSTPLVGLFVIFGSIGCFLFMVSDIVTGFRRRERWLSSKTFSLNSVTMLCLSMMSMLVVDLTTPMPSVNDQLAKLCGTALICMSMGVFMVTMGDGNFVENYWNSFGMFSFVLFVISFVLVQIKLGVIGLFRKEHNILVFCSLTFCYLMLYCMVDILSRKAEANDINKGVFSSNSQEGMLKRLKLCYIYGFNSNPQFVISKHPLSATVGGLCLLCTVVLLQAAFRSLFLKQLRFCNGTSDYGWTIWPIVIVQIVAVIVGCFITTYRWLCFVNHTKIGWIFLKNSGKKSEYVLDMNLVHFQTNVAGKFMMGFLYFLQMVILDSGVVLSKIVSICCLSKYKPEDNEEFQELIHEGYMGLDKWTVQMAVNDMERWIDKASKSKSLEFMSTLLVRNPSSHQQLTMEIRDREHPNRIGIEVSSLSMILLARIVEVSIPSLDLSPYLLKVFNEAYEIIEFIDSSVNSGNSKNCRKLRFAKAVKVGSDFSCLVQKLDLNHLASTDTNQPQNDQMAARTSVAIIEGLKHVFPNDFVRVELCAIIDFVNYQEHSASVKDLYDHMERVFADMLCALLAQLPNAISKQLLESPAEKYEERVRRALRILCMLQSSFPEGHHLLSWLTTPACSVQTINRTTEEADVGPHIIEVIDTSVN